MVRLSIAESVSLELRKFLRKMINNNTNTMTDNNSTIGYQFTPMPKQLTHILDVNLRSMLFALIDASNYFADEDGWFYRTNDQFQQDSSLSKNLVIATIDTLFQRSLVEVSCVGTGRGKQPNNYRVNLESFNFFEQLGMNTDLHRPENQIKTVRYSGSGYHASYLDEEPVRYLPELVKGRIVWNPVNPTGTSTPDGTTVPTTDTTKEVTKNVTKIEHNIDNIDTVYNKEYKENIDNLNNIENVNNKDIIESNNNKISTNNNILKENSKINNNLLDKNNPLEEKKELEREFEEGLTEPNSKNENEGKEYPNEYQDNKISSSEKQEPSVEELHEDGSQAASPSSLQSNADEQTQQEEESSTDEPQLTSREEFRKWKKLVDPELNKLKHITTRKLFDEEVKLFYKFYDQTVYDEGFSHDETQEHLESYIDGVINWWEGFQT